MRGYNLASFPGPAQLSVMCKRRKAGRGLGTRLDIILVAYAAALLCVSYLGGMGARQITRYESIMSDFNYMLLS